MVERVGNSTESFSSKLAFKYKVEESNTARKAL